MCRLVCDLVFKTIAMYNGRQLSSRLERFLAYAAEIRRFLESNITARFIP